MMKQTRQSGCSRCRRNPSGRDYGYGGSCRQGCPRETVCDDGDICRRLKEIDFALADTILYLDAYPCSKEALEYYHTLICTRRALVEMYEDTVGPVTAYGNESPTEWDWINTPWPWEADAN